MNKNSLLKQRKELEQSIKEAKLLIRKSAREIRKIDALIRVLKYNKRQGNN